ncbi:hypothetical protein BC826DRAFT_1111033 [Russula brevipes]|nr:hypothetical protein BC826DRAFT_1111033 [Russula brevipes]
MLDISSSPSSSISSCSSASVWKQSLWFLLYVLQQAYQSQDLAEEHSTAGLPSRPPLRLLSVSQPLLLADPPPDLTLTPAKQHFVNGVEVLCNGLLLFLEVLDLDILLIELPTAEQQSFVPPLTWQVLALLVDLEIVPLLVPNEDRLAPAAHVHIETENDALVGTSDSCWRGNAQLRAAVL